MTLLFPAAGVLAVLACVAPLAVAQPSSGSETAGSMILIGAARVDVTPDEPVRLAGYSARKRESEGVAQRLWAKAVAIGSDAQGPAVLVTVDNCAVPASVTDALARSLQAKAGVPREKFVLCSTHTHSAPCLAGALPTMFGEPVPADHQARIDRYTSGLRAKLERVIGDALADRRPGRLAWAQGRAGFAINRRSTRDGKYAGFGVNRGGPVDHALPVLRMTDPDGKLRAVVANYACHCTTLGSEFNQICGDWAGYAQEYLERDHAGAIGLVTIGCGADANPYPRQHLDDAQRHGREIAGEVSRLLENAVQPLITPPVCRFEHVRLPFERIPDRAEWELRAKGTGPAAYHAACQLARLDRGERLQTHLTYPVQTWAFGNELCIVFLGGEVVVDYALALKKEYGADRLWVTAYANDVPCYIPSRRILAEGGYEAEDSMTYYDRPGRLSPEVEDLIYGALRRLMPAGFAKGR